MSVDRYKEAGVDIEAGNALIRRIAPFAQATSRPEVLGGLGHFGALWSVPAGRYEDLVLVSATDGVGTKVKIAQAANRHSTIGIDLVAMCVNDLLCVGAEPFFFLDYYACGRLDVDVAAEVVRGIADGCTQAGCALVGGETAEMPGVYAEGVYDLAGFSVGGVERRDIVDGSAVREGMALVGLASSGLHSNGYSLARTILFEEQQLGLDASIPGLTGEEPLSDALLRPTRIYVRPVLKALSRFPIGAIAHITGGGLLENLPRVVPEQLSLRIDDGSWTVPPIFRFLAEAGGLEGRELYRTFNAGLGLVLVVEREAANELCTLFNNEGEAAAIVGEVVVTTDPDQRVRWA